MKDNLKNNQQGGIIEIIVLIIVALFVMKFLGITISGVINWFTTTFHNVLQ